MQLFRCTIGMHHVDHHLLILTRSCPSRYPVAPCPAAINPLSEERISHRTETLQACCDSQLCCTGIAAYSRFASFLQVPIPPFMWFKGRGAFCSELLVVSFLPALLKVCCRLIFSACSRRLLLVLIMGLFSLLRRWFIVELCFRSAWACHQEVEQAEPLRTLLFLLDFSISH